jgi:uncharacterized protein YacL
MELVMENNNSSEEILRELVRERVHKIRRFYTHLFVYLIGLVLYIAKTYFGAPLNFSPIRYINDTFMWILTFIIVVQGLRLLIKEQILGVKWEQNKINEIMQKENNTKKWK